MTQRQLAAIAKVPQPTIARIEAGSVVPRVDTLDRLLRACGEKLIAAPRLDEGHDLEQIRQLLDKAPAERLRQMAGSARNAQAFMRTVRRS